MKTKFVIALGFVLTLLMRFSLFEVETYDLVINRGWYEHIMANGGFLGLGSSISVYTPLYDLMLAFVGTVFQFLKPNAQLKLIGVFFDYLAAYFVFRLLKLKFPNGYKPIAAAFCFLLVPTVLINSSGWGQIDVIHTCGLLAFIYFIAVKKPNWALLAFGFAFTLKLQTIFLAPLLLVLLLNRQVSWKHIFLIPAVYFGTAIPALLEGYPLSKLLFLYAKQASGQPKLQYDATNIFQWMPYASHVVYGRLGIFLTLFATLIFAAVFSGVFIRKKVKLSVSLMVQLAFLSSLFVPYLLPRMHQRYFFTADAFSVVFAFFFPKFTWIAVVVCSASYLSYMHYYFGGQQPFPMPWMAVILGIAIGVVAKESYSLFYNEQT